MGLFDRRRGAEAAVPDETTLERARLKRDALGSLHRAHDLKKRSAAVRAELDEESSTNHYIERLREAWGVTG